MRNPQFGVRAATQMQFQTFPEERLTSEHREAWRAIQESVQQFDSPYFRPEFTRLVAQVRPNVEVTVLTHAGEHVGFFPFERKTDKTAEPVGNLLSDFHGVVARPDVHCSARELLEASGLRVWNFHHLLAAGNEFQTGYWRVVDALSMDLSQGFEAYRLTRRQSGSKHTKNISQRRRKLERELGPIVVDIDCRDERVFSQLWQWKSQQYRRHGLIDLPAIPWIGKLLRAIWGEAKRTFRGRLFALYANGELLAAEFALQSGPVLHSWFPAYDPGYAKYSVGHILRQEMARAAVVLDVRRIDLGKDEEPFKVSLGTKSVSIAEGSIDLNPFRRVMRKGGQRTFHWFRTTRAGKNLAGPYRAARKLMRSALG
jgi:CelD/BcsL family acetyltransferase involved in cellulose biosynthesis